MKKITLSSNQCLDGYICNHELTKMAKISSNAYKFWKNISYATYSNSRYIFLNINTIPSKYMDLAQICTKLNGYILSSAFCSLTGICISHLTKSNNSNLYNKLEFLHIDNIKLINLKKLYDDLGIDYSVRIYIEKCKYFSPEPFEKRIKLTNTLCLGYY